MRHVTVGPRCLLASALHPVLQEIFPTNIAPKVIYKTTHHTTKNCKKSTIMSPLMFRPLVSHGSTIAAGAATATVASFFAARWFCYRPAVPRNSKDLLVTVERSGGGL